MNASYDQNTNDVDQCLIRSGFTQFFRKFLIAMRLLWLLVFTATPNFVFFAGVA